MKLALTGGIGCGKSTVLEFFKESDWRTIDSDTIVRELLAENAKVQALLFDRWGKSVFAQDALVDRKALAVRVFSDPQALRWLEEILHPLVQQRWKSLIATASKSHWIIEVPLLFEKSLETSFDSTICVYCTLPLVESRMTLRGFSRTELLNRRKQQTPLKEKIDRADFIISNVGTLDFSKRQTLKLIQQLFALN